MIGRRARIKGIANIPVRRKTETQNTSVLENNDQNILADKSTDEKINNCEKDLTINDENSKNENAEINNTVTENISENKSKNETPINENVENQENKNLTILKNDNNVSEDNSPEFNDELRRPSLTETKPVVRKWVPKPKPTVSLASISRRPKPNPLTVKENTEPVLTQNIKNKEPLDTPLTNNSNIFETSAENANNLTTVITNNELNEHKCNLSNSNNESSLKPHLDTEKITPLSPNKIINRTRIRPIPKLIRRNSVQGSASESEDDTRKSYSRIRNDSVCSTNSYTTDSINTQECNGTATKQKIISIKVHKLFRRSEQSRKVAEARKDFYVKFGSKIPDRKRLTMMDLIYYNPVTNPMPQKEPTTTTINLETESTVIEEPSEQEILEEEQSIDNPEEPVSDEECTPVPQVKVGPNGEIILDEQSLVIEQTGTKKGREQLANSQIINGDDLNRTYGIYKRPKRAKEWSAMETLRFYRSLNTVGTDFSLMVSLFPGRTRRELKVKFKKEEKINRVLIDKALTNPIDFDLSELEKQAKEEEELEAKKKNNMVEKKKVKKDKIYKKKLPHKKFASKFSKLLDEEGVKICSRTRPKRKINKDLYSVLENGLEDILESGTDSEEDEYIPRKIMKRNIKLENFEGKKPTNTSNDIQNIDKQNIESNNNSVNIENSKNSNNQTESHNPKDIGINLTINEETRQVDIYDENQYEESRLNEIDKNEDSGSAELNDVEPGSLMILTNVGPDGKPICKVYMVTTNQAKVEVHLSPDVIQSLTSSLGTDEVVSLDLPVIDKNDNNPKKIIS